jgi:hypothetical protein
MAVVDADRRVIKRRPFISSPGSLSLDAFAPIGQRLASALQTALSAEIASAFPTATLTIQHTHDHRLAIAIGHSSGLSDAISGTDPLTDGQVH